MKISEKLFSYDKIFKQGQFEIPAGYILQISELSLIKSGEIPEHIQHCDEITYVVSGKATVYSGEESFELSAGQVHYIKEGQYHRIVADADSNFHYFCLGFTLKEDYAQLASFRNAVQGLPMFVTEDKGRIRSLFGQLLNESYFQDEESNNMIHFYFCQLLILLYRAMQGGANEKTVRMNNSASNHAVYQTLKYIDRNYITITSIQQIAKDLSYSEYYLSHIFKENMEMTMKNYLMQKKIMTAAELLKNSNMTISEIAEHLHFSSLHSFSEAFKRYMHTNARDFRRKSRT